MLKDRLAKEGYSVSIATDGLRALHRLNEENFDLVITDVLMPNIPGTVLLRLIKESAKDMPVILITSYPSAELEQYAKKTADAYLVKPFRTNQIQKTVRALIGKTVTSTRA